MPAFSLRCVASQGNAHGRDVQSLNALEIDIKNLEAAIQTMGQPSSPESDEERERQRMDVSLRTFVGAARSVHGFVASSPLPNEQRGVGNGETSLPQYHGSHQSHPKSEKKYLPGEKAPVEEHQEHQSQAGHEHIERPPPQAPGYVEPGGPSSQSSQAQPGANAPSSRPSNSWIQSDPSDDYGPPPSYSEAVPSEHNRKPPDDAQ